MWARLKGSGGGGGEEGVAGSTPSARGRTMAVDALVRRLDQKRDDIDPENLSKLVKTLEEAGINPKGRQLQQLSKQATELRTKDPTSSVGNTERPFERPYGEDYLDGLSLSAEVSRQRSREKGGSIPSISQGGSGRGMEGSRRSPRVSADSMSPCESPSSNGRFRAAVRTAVFVNRMKKGVKFSQTAEVRKFTRSSSFWDHEYWDEDVELEEGGSAELSNSIRLRAAAKAWYKEWESKLSVMPPEADLEEACDKLIEMWLSSGFTNIWFMNGLEDGIEAFCSRLQRHPYIALMTLAKLCQRPDSYFMESEERKEAALGTLYDRLHLLQNPDSSRSSSDGASGEGWSRRISDRMTGWGERLRRKLRRGFGLDR